MIGNGVLRYYRSTVLRLLPEHRSTVARRLAILLLFAICYLLSAISLHAASVDSGSAFLKIDPTARPSALAGAFIAESGSIDSLNYNPGGLAAMEHPEAAFTHTEWLENSNYNYLAYGHPTKVGTFALSAVRLDYGSFDGRNITGAPTGSFDAYDSAYSLSYAHELAGLGLGTDLKILDRKISNDHATSFAADLGGVGKIPNWPLRLGLSVLNIGPETKFINQSEPLPLTVSGGATYDGGRKLKISLALAGEPHDQRFSGLTGLEYEPIELLTLRFGYVAPFEATGGENLWDVTNVRGGIGIKISRFRLDWALASFGSLGLTNQFTLSMQFGPLAPEDKNLHEPHAAAPEVSNLFPDRL